VKRSEIKVGEVYAYQRSTNDYPARATVLDSRPFVRLRSSWITRDAEPVVITLEDGTTVQAPARLPESHDSSADRGVLCRLTGPKYSFDTLDQGEESTTVEVVRLATLRGPWAEGVAARIAQRERAQRVQRIEIEAARARAGVIAALNERTQAVLESSRTLVEGTHGDREVVLSTTTLAALLESAEKYVDLSNS